MPTIPVTPASAGGAGIGSFKSANRKPTMTPVKSAKITSFMYVPPFSLHYSRIKGPLLKVGALCKKITFFLVLIHRLILMNFVM